MQKPCNANPCSYGVSSAIAHQPNLQPVTCQIGSLSREARAPHASTPVSVVSGEAVAAFFLASYAGPSEGAWCRAGGPGSVCRKLLVVRHG